MTPAKSGDQDVEVGDVFVEITEKAQFPGFRFFRRGGIGAWPIQPTAFGEKVPNDLGKSTKDLDFGDQKSAERDRVIEHWNQNGNPG